VRGPYASRALCFHALNALCIAFIGMYRGELYHLPGSAWALSAALGGLGLFAPLVLPPRIRDRLLGGAWPLIIVLPFVGLLLSPRLFPSPVTVGPFLFCAGASFTTCIVVLWNVSRRKRAIRRSLEHQDALDLGVQSRLETYFATESPGATGKSSIPIIVILHTCLRSVGTGDASTFDRKSTSGRKPATWPAWASPVDTNAMRCRGGVSAAKCEDG
jgi:hypothetical protein